MSKTKNLNKPILTKQDLADVVVPLFEEVKHRVVSNEKAVGNLSSKIVNMEGKISNLDQKVAGLDQKVAGLDQKIDDKTHGLTVLLEQMDKKIDLSLEVSRLVTHQISVTQSHETRLRDLENNFQVLRKAVSRSAK